MVWVHKGRAHNPKLADASVLRLTFVYAVGVVMCFMLSYLAVVVTYPMARALIGGEETRLAYVVLDPKTKGSRGCRQAVRIAQMPFLFSHLCGTPPQMQDALSKGQTVYAIGRGNELGVFYRRFEF